MDSKALRVILEDELRATSKDARFQLPHGTRITLFLATNSSVVPVPKVDAVSFHDNYIVLEGDDGRFFTDLDTIVAVRADDEAGKTRDLRVGFA